VFVGHCLKRLRGKVILHERADGARIGIGGDEDGEQGENDNDGEHGGEGWLLNNAHFPDGRDHRAAGNLRECD
jgi:hypothetical protein